MLRTNKGKFNMESIIYSCERYNPYTSNTCFIIADEREIISSPTYLHTFKDKLSKKEYGVISDNIGISMPYLKTEKEFIVGTSQYMYFFDFASKKAERKLLNSPCEILVISHNKIIAICECDVVIMSASDKQIVAELEFNDVIADYKILQNSLSLSLMEGKEYKINL